MARGLAKGLEILGRARISRVDLDHLAGTILFSGPLYVMALTGVTAIGAAVPVGGAAFLVGWAALFVCGLRKISGSTGE